MASERKARVTNTDTILRICLASVVAVYMVYSRYEIQNLKLQIRHLQSKVESLGSERVITKDHEHLKHGLSLTRSTRSMTNEEIRNQLLELQVETQPTIQSLTFREKEFIVAQANANVRNSRRNKKKNKNKPEGRGEHPALDDHLMPSITSRTDMGSPKNVGSRRSKSGSTFVRWGKPSCTEAASPVYSGYAAAAYSAAGYGGATQLECLPTDPTWHPNSNTDIMSKTLLTTAKFSLGEHVGVFPPSADNSIVECAVCFTRKPTTLMIPGWTNCPPSWRREYTGYLMSTPGVASEFYFSSSNYCVDRNPDTYFTGHNDTNGLRLTFVQAGLCFQRSAPCTEYRKKKRISCAVCSKLR